MEKWWTERLNESDKVFQLKTKIVRLHFSNRRAGQSEKGHLRKWQKFIWELRLGRVPGYGKL